jgi:hypothetical protein
VGKKQWQLAVGYRRLGGAEEVRKGNGKWRRAFHGRVISGGGQPVAGQAV